MKSEKLKIVPALLYAEEITRKSIELFYTDDYLFYSGYFNNEPIKVSEDDAGGTLNQFAIVYDNNLIGYISYRIDYYGSNAYNFGLISFDKGNINIGKALQIIIDQIKNKYNIHRMEFRCISGNPAKRSYDYFCKKYNGRILELKDCFKDRTGKYRNEFIYEIIFN